MKWPTWGRVEKRESSYTDLLVGLAIDRAGGTTGAAIGATSALQAASGLVSRAFSAATVLGPENVTRGVTPAVLSTIGRALVRAGECIHLIDIDPDGGVVLQPVGQWDVWGGVDEASWYYRCTREGPSRTITRRVPSAGLCHFRAEIDPSRPWKGIGPLQSAAIGGRLSAEVAQALADGESGPRGALLPIPVGGDDPSVAQLKADIRNLRGQTATVESVRLMSVGAAGNAPAGDWEAKRLGGDPPRAEVDLLTAASAEIYAACGCSGLFGATTAQAARESFRRFLHSTIQPMGALVAHELSAKLEEHIELDFSPLGAADVQARARAWRSLAGPEASMTPDIAARLAGLEVGIEP